ncbi:hypothetical protein C8R43DRAFT_949257 [Mycena crocata]|nr:hypothetical protein C8R43DRAFT_949257 [Mycena crocata]
MKKLWLSTPNVKRLHVEYCLVDEELEDEAEEAEEEDAWNISNFSQEYRISICSLLPPLYPSQWPAGVLPSLQELILEVPFQLSHLKEIIPVIPELCPNLKRLKFKMSPAGYKEFLDPEQMTRISKFFKANGAEYQSFEELRLPFSGIHYDLITALPCIFSSAPKLAHLYLGNPRILDTEAAADSALLLQRAGSYAVATPSLRSVSWDRLVTANIERDSAATATRCIIGTFKKPLWEEQQGMAGWYKYYS